MAIKSITIVVGGDVKFNCPTDIMLVEPNWKPKDLLERASNFTEPMDRESRYMVAHHGLKTWREIEVDWKACVAGF
jgi:hypothetical protein